MTELTRAALWTRMRFLLDRLIHSIDSETFVDQCLDTLLELLGADRGMVLLGRPGSAWRKVGARHRRRRDLSAVEQEEISRTTVDHAFGAGRCIIWEPGHDDSEAPRMSMMDLGILVAMAAPLRHARLGQKQAEGGIQGIVYLDFRAGRTIVGELHREFFEAAVILIAAVLDMRERLHMVREDLRFAQAQTVDNRQGPTLEEFLRAQSLDDLRKEIKACVHGRSSVLVLGESGTGKTRLATLIAEASGRLPVVRATLGASDDLNTITSELFGHERGAFSGAVSKRIGLVEHADGGTLILDEILNLPPHAQQLLLDFTQFGTYRPLGFQGIEPKRADVRIIAATNGNIMQAIQDTRFRQDLYFRLAAVPITLPPLRDRRAEVPGLAESFLRRTDPGCSWRLSVSARRLLLSEELHWAGNIRELEGVMQRARDRANAEEEGESASLIDSHHLNLRSASGQQISVPAPGTFQPEAGQLGAPNEHGAIGEGWRKLIEARTSLDDTERELIHLAMSRFRGVISHAARELGLSRTSLMSRMDTLSIDRNKYRR